MADLLMSNNQMIISDPSRSVEYYGNLKKKQTLLSTTHPLARILCLYL